MISADKPEYRVPLVSEVAKIKGNGLTVASTFSGCGGSSFGYRLAGFRVVWANEFVPIAQESYRANMMPSTVLDGRDIKAIKPQEILKAIGLKIGELDVLDGSPPCQAFSTAGKREKGWGKERKYEHGASQKNEDLFIEFVRIRNGLMPRAFIAENVSGLIKGVAKGYFIDILKLLKVGYRVEARLLDAQWLGVPQARQRIIFVGVREDLSLDPEFPTPLPYRYSVRDAIPWIGVPPLRVTQGNGNGHSSARGNIVPIDRSSPTVIAIGGAGQFMIDGHESNQTEKRKFTIAELRRICAFPDDFKLHGSYSQQWERLGNSVPPVMMQAIATVLRDKILLPIRETGSRKRKQK